MHKRLAVFQPHEQFLHLLLGLGIEHEIGPVEQGFDAVGGEVEPEARALHFAGGKQVDVFGRQYQAAAHGRFARVDFLEPEHFFLVEKMIGGEELLYFKAPGQVFAAQQELHRFPRRQKAAEMIAPRAADGAKIAALGHELQHEVVEEVGLDVGDQGSGQDEDFVGA